MLIALLLGSIGSPATSVSAQSAAPAVTPVTPTPAPPPASVTEEDTTGHAEYDALVLRALAAYDAGRWDEARGLFERAHALDPTARTLRTIGMTAFNQGDYVAALVHLEAALVDTRKPLTDEQRAHVLGLIDRANRNVGRFRVRLSPSSASLLVDGAPPLLIGDDELVLRPGHHVLRATALGHLPLERALDVQGQQRDKLDLTLQPEGATGEPAPPPVGPAPPTAEPRSEVALDTGASSDTTLGIVALSVGGAALIASGVTLGLALSDKSDLDHGCPDRVCPPELEDTRSRYQTLRVVSPIALGVGVVSAAVGVVLLLNGGDGDAGVDQSRAWLTPSGLGVRGTL